MSSREFWLRGGMGEGELTFGWGSYGRLLEGDRIWSELFPTWVGLEQTELLEGWHHLSVGVWNAGRTVAHCRGGLF